MLYKGGYIDGKKHLRTYLGDVLAAEYTDPIVTILSTRDYSYPIGFAKKTRTFTNATYLGMWDKYSRGVIGAENGLKYGSIRNDNGTYNWTESDDLINFAKARGLKVHWHCLLWNQDIPLYLENQKSSPDAYNIFKNDIIATIDAVIDRYGADTFVSCDAVNEQITATGAQHINTWYNVLGLDMFDIPFKRLYERAPNIVAMYNDFDLETGNENRTNTLISIKNRLESKGIPFGGVGFQFHTVLGQNIDVARSRFRRWNDLGVKVMITELDVQTNVGGRGTVYTPEMANELAKFYVDIFDAYEKAVTPANRLGIIFWSVDDNSNYLNRNGVIHYPVLFNGLYQPKLSYDYVVDRLRRKPEIHEIYQDFELGNIGTGSFIGSKTGGTSPATWRMVSADAAARAEVTDEGLSMAQTNVDVTNNVVVKGSSPNFIVSTRTGKVFEFDARVMGFQFRFIDNNNTWFVQAYKSGTTDVYRLIKRQGGPETVMHTSTIKPVWGQIIEVVCNGNTISYSIDGVLQATVTDSAMNTGTDVGFRFKGHYNADKFSSFKFIKYDPIK